MKELFTPFTSSTHRFRVVVLLVELALALVAWQVLSGGLVPGPVQVVERIALLLSSGAVLDDLMASLSLTARGMGISVVVALLIAYASVVGAVRPFAKLVVQLRYLTLTGLIFLFTLLTNGGGQLKLSLLVFGIVPFFTTSLLGMMRDIPQEEFDLCRTLRMGPWRILWEVVIVGRADAVFDVVRQNFAIAWMMITMVEGLSMSEGGLGTLMIKSSKYIDLTTVFALLAMVLFIGLGCDALLKRGRTWLFPYTR